MFLMFTLHVFCYSHYLYSCTFVRWCSHLQLFWYSSYTPFECIIQSCWCSHYTSFDVHITVRLLFTLNSCRRSHYIDIFLCSHHNFFWCSYVKHCFGCPYCIDLSVLITVHSVFRWHCFFSSHFSFGVHIMLLFCCSHYSAFGVHMTRLWVFASHRVEKHKKYSSRPETQAWALEMCKRGFSLSPLFFFSELINTLLSFSV